MVENAVFAALQIIVTNVKKWNEIVQEKITIYVVYRSFHFFNSKSNFLIVAFLFRFEWALCSSDEYIISCPINCCARIVAWRCIVTKKHGLFWFSPISGTSNQPATKSFCFFPHYLCVMSYNVLRRSTTNKKQ